MENELPLRGDTYHALTLEQAQRKLWEWQTVMKHDLGLDYEQCPRSVYIDLAEIQNLLTTYSLASSTERYIMNGARLYFTFATRPSGVVDCPYAMSVMLVPVVSK